MQSPLSKDNERLKKEILTEHNRLRTNPKSYIPILERNLKYFLDGNILEKPGSDSGIETEEGPAAYKEAINFLKTQKPIAALILDDEISKASQSHAIDIGKQGSVDHKGSDNSTADTRVSKFIEWDITIGENIDFGGTSGEEVMISWLVDDGVPSRSHRLNWFNTKVKYFGIGVSNHKEYEVCSVIDYVGEILSYIRNNEWNKKWYKPISKMKSNVMSTSIKSNVVKKTNNNEVANGNKAVKALMQMAHKKEDLIKRTKSSAIKHDERNINEPLYEEEMEEDCEGDELENDPDAPEGCVSCKVKIITSKIGKKVITKTIKTYTLENGDEEEVTCETTKYV